MDSELIWPGVPVTACATMRPLASNIAVARSPASRTTGLKAMRCSARACSLTTLMQVAPEDLEFDAVERHGVIPSLRRCSPSGRL